MKIKKEIQESVIYDYTKTNIKVKDIAEKHKLCRHSIRNIIVENNLKLREGETNIEIVNQIIYDYKNNITNKEISKKYNLNRGVVQSILKRNNIKLKTLSESSRKHNLLDENYFNNIDTNEKAYILGLLYSDGYINKNGFGISLHEKDKEILEKISNIIYGKVVLGYRKERETTYSNKKNYISNPQYRLEVASNTMKNDLISHGCVKNKTFKIRLPKLNNINLYRAFIRGYFDGDGSLCIPKNRKQNITFTITSNVDFCEDIKNYVNENFNVHMKSIVRYENVGLNRLTGAKQVIRFMNWLYEDADIFLKRKFDIFNHYLPVEEQRRKKLLKINKLSLNI